MQYRIWVPLTLLVSAVLIVLINLPGLSGAWVLDDIDNLSGLSALGQGGVSSWVTYVFGGVGSTGRPLALLTFAFQHSDWPDPAAFKLVNYILHSINFLLVVGLLRGLFQVSHQEVSGKQTGLFWLVIVILSLAWAAAPIQTTTVHYVVQRMALLSAFWMLLAVNWWVYWLYLSEKGTPRNRLILASVGVFVFTSLGIISKENAILAPLLCVLISSVMGEAPGVGSREKVVASNVILVPIYLLIAVLVIDFERYFITSFEGRNFDAVERFLTQLRIIPVYVIKTLFPLGQEFRLFWENFEVSKGLWSPASTLIGLFGVVGSLLLGFFLRRRSPLIAIGIFFYFICHLLESTFLSLELYFEHRNYLSSVGLFIALLGVFAALPRKVLPLATACAMIVAAFFMLVTWQEAKIWGSPLHQAIRWYNQQPLSERAHDNLLTVMVNSGLYNEANEFYRETSPRFDSSLTMRLHWMAMGCRVEELDPADSEKLILTAELADYEKTAIGQMSYLVNLIEAGVCDASVVPVLLSLSQTLLSNPSYSPAFADLHVLSAKMYFYGGAVANAKLALAQALRRTQRLDILIAASQLELASGNSAKAEYYFGRVEESCDGKNYFVCFKNKNMIEAIKREIEAIN